MKKLSTTGLHDRVIAWSQKKVVANSFATFINHRGEVISVASRQEMMAYNQEVVIDRPSY